MNLSLPFNWFSHFLCVMLWWFQFRFSIYCQEINRTILILTRAMYSFGGTQIAYYFCVVKLGEKGVWGRIADLFMVCSLFIGSEVYIAHLSPSIFTLLITQLELVWLVLLILLSLSIINCTVLGLQNSPVQIVIISKNWPLSYLLGAYY